MYHILICHYKMYFRAHKYILIRLAIRHWIFAPKNIFYIRHIYIVYIYIYIYIYLNIRIPINSAIHKPLFCFHFALNFDLNWYSRGGISWTWDKQLQSSINLFGQSMFSIYCTFGWNYYYHRHITKNRLWKSSQSVCTEHWTEAVGVVAPRPLKMMKLNLRNVSY